MKLACARVTSILAVAMTAACHSMPPLEHVTHIEVRSNLDSLGVITDSARVAEIVDFVNEMRKGWKTPLIADVAVPDIAVEFYDGNRVRGSFGAGRDFFVTQRVGDFFERGASRDEMTRFRTFVADFRRTRR